jgi:hypothetical protein
MTTAQHPAWHTPYRAGPPWTSHRSRARRRQKESIVDDFIVLSGGGLVSSCVGMKEERVVRFLYPLMLSCGTACGSVEADGVQYDSPKKKCERAIFPVSVRCALI